MFKFLPDAEIDWRDVWLGAFVTALLFSFGKTFIGIYLGNSAVASSFGTAGSLILLLLWIYYSAQILFFGAEFTQVYANKYGLKIVPEDEAVKKGAHPEAPSTRDVSRRPALPEYPAAVDESRLEREDRQIARFVLGLMAASFLTGIMTMIFGFKKR